MLEKLTTFKIENVQSIYGGTNGEGEPMETVTLSYSKIETAEEKSK